MVEKKSVGGSKALESTDELATRTSSICPATDPMGFVATNTYDANGNLLSVTAPTPGNGGTSAVTQFAYDPRGELTQITDPLNHVTTITYFPTGLIQTITDAQNHITTYGYDSKGNRTSVTDAANNTTTFAYDAGLPRTTLDTPIFFDLNEVRSAIDLKNGLVLSETSGKPIKGPLTGSFDNFLMRLDGKLNDVRYDFLLKPRSRKDSASLTGLLRDFVGLGSQKVAVTVIDLSSVPFDVRPTVAAQIGRLAFEFNY